MVKVTGPAMSMDASGKLGGVVVFSKWKGRNYVRRLVKPANPKSGGQTGVRAMMKFLSQDWTNIATSEKYSWEGIAEQYVISTFNAYIKENMLRNRNFLAPSQAYPPALTETIDEIDVFTATPGVRQITIEISDLNVNTFNWGFLIFRSTGIGFTPAFDNLVCALPSEGASSAFFVDTPLEPDTYYYDAKPFTVDAVLGALDGEINGVVV